MEKLEAVAISPGYFESAPDQESCKQMCDSRDGDCNVYLYKSENESCTLFTNPLVTMATLIEVANILGGPTNCKLSHLKCVRLLIV